MKGLDIVVVLNKGLMARDFAYKYLEKFEDSLKIRLLYFQPAKSEDLDKQYYNKNYLNYKTYTPEWALLNSRWLPFSIFQDLSLEDYVRIPEKRFSDIPSPENMVLFVDDECCRKNTFLNVRKDFIKMGYDSSKFVYYAAIKTGPRFPIVLDENLREIDFHDLNSKINLFANQNNQKILN